MSQNPYYVKINGLYKTYGTFQEVEDAITGKKKKVFSSNPSPNKAEAKIFQGDPERLKRKLVKHEGYKPEEITIESACPPVNKAAENIVVGNPTGSPRMNVTIY
jgi:hypothetical protein